MMRDVLSQISPNGAPINVTVHASGNKVDHAKLAQVVRDNIATHLRERGVDPDQVLNGPPVLPVPGSRAPQSVASL